MKNKIKILPIIFFIFSYNYTICQNYSNLNIKEQYDKMQAQIHQENSKYYENNETESYGLVDKPGSLGDGMGIVLASYLNMFKTTKDKAYLIKLEKENEIKDKKIKNIKKKLKS